MTKYNDSNYGNTLVNDADLFIGDYYDDLLESIKEGDVRDLHSFMTNDDKLDSIIDSYFSLREAVDILENCENEECDSTLWMEQEPKQAIQTMAFYSYRNDLIKMVGEMIKDKLQEETANIDEQIDTLQEKVDNLSDKEEHEKENLEDKINDLFDYGSNVNNVIDNI